MNEGIHDLSNEEYHSSVGISKSGLTEILRSPAHYWEKYLNPDREPKGSTPAMFFGSAVHKMVLEPEEFLHEYTVIPSEIASLNKNTKKYKEFVAEIAERGKLGLQPDDFGLICGIDSALKNHPYASGLLTGGLPEKSFFWTDKETGVLCKCRPDYWIEGMCLPDLKTTADARPQEFTKSCANFGYYMQEAFYTDGVEAVTGERLPMPFVAVEKEPPFSVGLYKLDEDDVAYGRRRYRKALRIYAECLERDKWPGLPEEIQTIFLPAWSKKDDE